MTGNKIGGSVVEQEKGDHTGGLLGRGSQIVALRAALAGSPGTRCVAITGDPGIGKSRLLAECATLAENAGWVVRAARSTEFASHVPFGVFVNVLDDLLADLGPHALAGLGQENLGLLAAMFPAITAAEPVPIVDAERYRLYRAVRALLETVTGPGGLALLIDDLHWTDGGSIELLDHLLRHPPRVPLLLAVAGRPRQISPRLWHTLSRASTDGVAEILDLGPLSRADADLLIPRQMSRSRREELYRASAGNPFYLEALTREGVTGASTDGVAPQPEGTIPMAVHAVLAAELAALTASQRVVAHAAAVVGDDFDAKLVAETAAMDAASVFAELDRLADRDLVRPDPSTGLFRYRHPLVRGIAYQDASPGWRLQAHGRAASALRSRGASRVALAEHVARSAVRGDLAAVAELTDAARYAAAANAGHFLRAALRLLPDGEQATPHRLLLLGRLAQALATTGELRQARETLREVLRLLPDEFTALRAQAARACAGVERFLGHNADARAMLHGEWLRAADTDAHAAAVLLVALAVGECFERDRRPEQDWVAEAVTATRRIGDAPLLTMALSIAALRQQPVASVTAHEQWLDEAAGLLDALPDDDLIRDVGAMFWLGWAEISTDRLVAAGQHVDRGLRLARTSGQTDVVATLTAIRGVVHAYLGELAEAEICYEDGLDLAELMDSDELRGATLTVGCWTATWRGDLAEAVRLGEAAVAADNRSVTTNNLRNGQAELILAQAMLYAGDPHGCIELLLGAGGGPELTAWDSPSHPLAYLLLTEAEVALGRPAAASDWALRAQDTADRLGLPLRAATARLARAVATLPVDPAAAVPLAVAAAEAFTALGIVVQAGRAHLLTAVALADGGELDQAREHFRSARARFTSSDAQLFLPQVAREERRMNARRPRADRPGADPARSAVAEHFDLTAREVEIAALVADGLTNRDIGQRLHLSPKTVEAHLSRVYMKVRVSGRTALAGVWAAATPHRSEG